MSEYKKIYDSEQAKNYINEALSIITNKSDSLSFEDLYWLSKILYVYGDSDTLDEELIIKSIRLSFRKGLNNESNKEIFLDASVMMSRLYFKYGKYELAINYLMYLVDLLDEIPNWVHTFYAYAQVLSDEHFKYILKQPKHFFARLDKITKNGFIKRNEILLEFLQRFLNQKEDLIQSEEFQELTEDEQDKLLQEKDSLLTPFIEKANEYGIGNDFDNLLYPKSDLEQLLDEKDEYINELLFEIEGLKKQNNSINIDETEKLLIENTQLKSEIESQKSEIANLNKIINNLQKQNRIITSQLTDAVNNIVPSSSNENDFEEEQESFENDFDNGHELLTRYQQNQKILVIGAGNKDNLLIRAKKRGFIEKDFDFVLDYDKIANVTAKMNFGGYAAIICGPMPHSTSGKEAESSLITMLEKNYKNVKRAVTVSGKLKLSDSAFSNALECVMRNLYIIDNDE